jgi:F-type H+-transporting ATPase subunit delta
MTMPGSFGDSVAAGNVISAAELERVEKLYEEILLETSPNRLAARIATVYAEALLNVAEKRGQTETIGQELDSLVHELFTASPDLEAFLANPAVHRRRKMAVLDKAIAGKCSSLMEDFLRMLCRHDRLTHLRIIAVSFHALRDRMAKRMRILVESAVPLEPAEQERLQKMLRDALHQEPVLISRIRPELLGGLLVHVGDTVFDSTVLYRLETLRTQFLSRGNHEIQTGRDRFSSN